MTVARPPWFGTGWIALALIALASLGACAQTESSPEGFLRDLYQRYSADTAPNPTGDTAGSLFDPELLAAIRLDRHLANGEVGVLDHDPICSCQDYDPLTAVTISVDSPVQERVHASVSFMNGLQPVKVGYQLRNVNGLWRISDIEEANVPSLKRFLEEGIAGLQKNQSNR